jgi:hypothetical protein
MLSHVTFLKRWKDLEIIPKGLFLKSAYISHQSSKIIQRASKALLRDRLRFQQYRKASLTQTNPGSGNFYQEISDPSGPAAYLHCCEELL